MTLRRTYAPLIVGLIVHLGIALAGMAQGLDLSDRPVANIRLEGIERVDPSLVYNQIRIKKGDPYDHRIVAEDIRRLTHLNKFSKVEARVEPDHDGAVILIYAVKELPLISDVQVVGNKILSDQELLGRLRLRAGDPADDYLIDRASKQIVSAYEESGYFDTTAKATLSNGGILLLQVVEGPRLRIRAIRFVGNDAFSDKQLQSKIRSRAYVPLLRKGEFSRRRTLDDVSRLRQFYQDRGYLDAEVVREFQTSPDGRNALVTFTVHEGHQHIVSDIIVSGNQAFSSGQIRKIISLQVGDVFSVNQETKSKVDVTNRYGDLGFIEAKVEIDHAFVYDEPYKVDVLIVIDEGRQYSVGKIIITGNNVTQDRVIRRQIRDLWPGRRYVSRGIERTEQRLSPSALFEKGRVTVLGDPEDEFRDLLIEVKEKNTGSIGFGAGVSSDSGLVGAFDIAQRNFDILDGPETLGELLTGKAFIGAGQYMRLALQPGNETSRYSVTFREPYLLDSNVFLNTSGFFFERQRSDYDEQRVGGTLGLGQRFGQVWSASIQSRVEKIDLDNIDPDAPIDVFDVQGENGLTSLGLAVTRNTVDNRTAPTQGSRLVLNVSRAGALGGDYNFTKASVDIHKFWTLKEDFFGRRTVLAGHLQLGHIFEDSEAPVFERFYAGGHRTFRGFGFRGIGPRGIRADTGTEGIDPIGGEILFLAGVQYSIPLYHDSVRGVVFIDSGTVQQDFSLDQYRAAIGGGLRLQLPFLGSSPAFALDVAVPIAKENGDEEQVFSFNLGIPF